MSGTIYAVFMNTDDTEGRGREYVAHLCATEATARRLGRRGYVQGGDCPVREYEPRTIDGADYFPISLLNIEQPTKEDIEAQKRIDAKRAAYDRARSLGMTDDEIRALIGGAA